MTTILTNSTVYLGTNLFGKVQKFTCPELEMNGVDIKNGYGSYKLPTGANSLSVSMELLCLDADVFKKVSNPFEEINFTVYGSLSEYRNETLEKETQAKLILRGSLAKKQLLGELTLQENTTNTIELNISAYKLIVGNETLEQYDVPNLIWKIDGRDILAKVKRNLGM